MFDLSRPTVLFLRVRAFLLCGDSDRARDLMQTTLAKLFQHWAKASRADNLDAYARTVLTRTFLAEQRRHWRDRQAHAQSDVPTGASRLALGGVAMEPSAW